MLDFVEQNYVWFIGGAIFIVLIVIGYIAEQTDFGHKKIERKAKPEEPINKKEVIKEIKETKEFENIKLNDVVYKGTEAKAEEVKKVEDISTIKNEPVKPNIPFNNDKKTEPIKNDNKQFKEEKKDIPFNNNVKVENKDIKENNKDIESEDQSVWEKPTVEVEPKKEEITTEEDIWDF